MADSFVRKINQSNLQGVSGTKNLRCFIANIWNGTTDIYHKNKEEALKGKNALEMEQGIQSIQNDPRFGDNFHFINLFQETTLQQKLISRTPGKEKIDSLNSTLQSCEDMRRLSWFILRQNKEKAWDAMRAHRATLTDLITDSQECFETGDFKTYADKLMEETNANERYLKNIGRAGWWDLRGTGGVKIYKLI